MRAKNRIINRIINRAIFRSKRSIFYIILSIIFCISAFITSKNVSNNTVFNNVSLFNNATTNKKNTNINIETCEYVRTKDGDTIVVLLNGKEETVRLLSIDCSESVHPDKTKNSIDGEIASSYTKGVLRKYKTLYLTNGKNDRDKYDRLLRVVWLEMPTDPLSKDELENKTLEGLLIKKNLCVVKDYNDYTYYNSFLEIYNKYNLGEKK